MEKLKPGPLSEALARNREACNARFAAARRQYPHLSEDLFLPFLSGSVDALSKTIYATESPRLDSAVLALYDMALEWTGHSWPGAVDPEHPLRRAWETVLNAYPLLLARDTARFSGAVFNAAYQLHHSQLDLMAWAETLGALSGRTSNLEQWQSWGVVAAWRTGAASYRQAALAVLEKATPDVGAALLRLKTATPQWNQLLTDLKNHPWRPAGFVSNTASRQWKLLHRIGSFRGFGGAFVRPPQVKRSANGWIVSCDNMSWQIDADAYGATLQRTDEATSSSKAETQLDGLEKDAALTATAFFKTVEDVTGLVSHGANAVALSTKRSHAVHIFVFEGAA